MNDTQDFKWNREKVKLFFKQPLYVYDNRTLDDALDKFEREQSPSSVSDAANVWSFTTHDGEEIKDKRQKVFGAYPIKHGTEFTTYEKSVGELEGAKGWTWFSTPEARDEYVRLNTKDYSLQQIQDAFAKSYMNYGDAAMKQKDFLTALTNSNS